MTNNLINNNYNFLGSLYNFKNVKPRKASASNLTLGSNVDLYTAPSNKKAVMIGMCAFNTVSFTQLLKIKISGNYYNLFFNNGFLGAAQNFDRIICIDSNQTIAVTDNVGGTNLWLNILEFDSSANLSINYITSFINGNNTLYTCPANKIAVPISLYSTNIVSGNPGAAYQSINSPSAGITNYSGGTITYKSHIVASGGTPNTTNDFNAATTLVNNGRTYFLGTTIPVIAASHLTAGESIVVNSNSANAGQTGYVYALEFPV